ncbi:LLM class flavin-dependent oxidoreductase [Natronobacterium gregoryi]|uniref:5,10-methylenetetrahydromethanopterin reductase n=2 Tax=Natronobacterium gregoryi TaxID=44930 RepID=L0AH75_NATGS|nr:LLM class flavin-dependent oxidoreductase [Natronobacterium gregoryi]AFZ72784.1 flavin-dependent oxidoreductase, F420-dependent methylene-tetrahydromethanopterin reductase [Natronobacterium gregoryi SP2]ELY69451.1 5,10-methylenetetrahydromethanopterin reductase [Natronobacterium gregoryi SP2]PLK21126.1 LLM class flavin-dependent oxidoreductase [Natronobacterium gregoryi SP2]SFJ10840.1 Flavin-dependent oxidoreductase, luciferase family (includes alkanesulfonate monooxygenase SsuD and methylen
MHLGLVVPRIASHDPTDLAVDAEELGYDSVWMGELWGTSSVVKLTEIATRTESIELGTAIVNVFSRSPGVLAMTAATLDRVADGRVSLGLGTSTPTAIENVHGMGFERPIRRSHETIAVVSRILGDDDPVSYEGELISVTDVPPLDETVPIYQAALGPANRRVVGRLCDGWIPHNIPFTTLDDAFEVVADAARERNRDPAEITVAPYVPVAVSEDPEEAYDAVRGHVAYYAGSAAGYRNAIATVFSDRVEAVAEAWQAGDRDGATGLVTDEMVDELGVAGTPGCAREKLRALVSESVVDRPLLTIPEQAADEIAVSTIEAFAPLSSNSSRH